MSTIEKVINLLKEAEQYHEACDKRKRWSKLYDAHMELIPYVSLLGLELTLESRPAIEADLLKESDKENEAITSTINIETPDAEDFRKMLQADEKGRLSSGGHTKFIAKIVAKHFEKETNTTILFVNVGPDFQGMPIRLKSIPLDWRNVGDRVVFCIAGELILIGDVAGQVPYPHLERLKGLE